MCEARVVLRSSGEEKTLMDDVSSIVSEDKQVKITSILGETMHIDARIAAVDNTGHPHKVILEAIA